MKRRGISAILVAVLVACGIVAGVVSTPAPATAISPSQWDPGFIISDAVFFDSSTMPVSAIQTFLNGKLTTCRTGYVCLKDFRQDTTSKPAQTQRPGHCAAYAGAAQESAAQIISKASIACGINPQVLLVLLQKEQSLVTDTWPLASQYARATGFGCPDTAPCDARYSTFQDQVYSAAWQFRQYTLTPNSWNFRVGSNFIGYNPNASCGASAVNIRNQATANLYIYTPYQPNAATLSFKLAGGPPVSAAYPDCGAFGNVNFAILFDSWFGSPTGQRHGNFDTISAGYGGIKISGWSVDPSQASSSYIWVNVDGVGGPFLANKPLPWINALYPGYGANHGFSETIPATAGDHEVCVYGTLALLSCKTVRVPKGTGSLDTAAAYPGGIQIEGWSVDYSSTAPSYIWVNVDGQGGPRLANKPLPWIDSYFPGIGSAHGFSERIPAAKGVHEICVYGVESLLQCRKVTVATSEDGSFDSVGITAGGLRVTGWSVDLTTQDPSYVWINVNGTGTAYRASTPLSWFEALYPGAGINHGLDVVVPSKPGRNEVCVYGTSKLLGCKILNVPISDGALDSVTGGTGQIVLSGWSVDLRSKAPSYIWVNVDGTGGPHVANSDLGWFEALYPGAGTQHGFNVTVPTTSGQHQVCVYGTDILLGCRTVSVG